MSYLSNGLEQPSTTYLNEKHVSRNGERRYSIRDMVARTERRFRKKLVVREDGCLIYTGYLCANGYGRFKYFGGGCSAHVYAYQLAHGPIPNGMTVDHTCFVPACCNPEHLRLLTGSENTSNNRKSKWTTCINGHPFDEENTYIRPNTGVNGRKGRRTCRACDRTRARIYRARAEKAKRNAP